ncbi:M28 family metallopeptidase (plasmid) [Pseudoalteromonas sp. T1lg65]|uniref:M28 family metallopeptidase n=1 Tax=Pseudoalteromonas sp. T1lg65 TaxID=2077101 RepID=UPI003F7901E5
MKYAINLLCAAVLINTTAQANVVDDDVWISIDATAGNHYQMQQATKGESFDKVDAGLGVQLLKLSEKKHAELSEFMHDNYHRCGGFVAHHSLSEAKQYVAQLAQASTNSALVSYSIDNGARVNSLLSRVSTTSMESTVSSLTGFYNRYYTAQTGVDASSWIKQRWSDIAQSRTDINVEFFNHSWQQPSVVATIQGAELSNEIVIIGGHLDSINVRNRSGVAPGADDNASGISVLTEALKAIVEDGYKPKRTIHIMGFAAEEVGLRGSKDIAETYKSQGKNVVGMVQFDMTGNQGSNLDIVMMTDYTNSAQNQFLSQLLDTYMPEINYGFDQCGYGCSDHASWYQQGFPASMPFESRMSDANRRIHTPDDTVYNVQHAQKFAKLSVAFLAEMAKNAGDDDPDPDPGNKLENGVTKTGIFGAAKSQSFFTLEVPQGAKTLKFWTAGGTGDADLYVKFGSKPSLNDYDCNSTTSTSDENCVIDPIQVGTYHVMVEAWNQISGVSLTGQYTEDTTGPTPINVTHDGISVARGEWQHFSQSLSAGYNELKVTISGGSGDGDLYLNLDSEPTTSTWRCRPYKSGNQEVCTVSAPEAGTWYMSVRGYQASSNITMTITAN